MTEQLISKNKDVQRKEIYFNAKLTANTVVTGGHTVIFDRVSSGKGTYRIVLGPGIFYLLCKITRNID